MRYLYLFAAVISMGGLVHANEMAVNGAEIVKVGLEEWSANDWERFFEEQDIQVIRFKNLGCKFAEEYESKLNAVKSARNNFLMHPYLDNLKKERDFAWRDFDDFRKKVVTDREDPCLSQPCVGKYCK